jgi:ParB family chromosome partitioning protein
MFTFESNEIVMIPIDKIDLPETPLRLFEPRSREEIENLAESIRQSGLIHPIIVARKAEGGRFVILGGETRFRASNLAGKTEVPCRIVQIKDDPGEASLIALMDNLARKNMHPLDIADALRRQLDHVDRFEQIYRPLGWTKGRFSQILATF